MDDSLLKQGFLGQRMIVLPKAVKNALQKNVITSSFFVTDIGYYPNASKHHRTRQQGSKEFIFIYCTQGNGFLKIADHTYKVGPNQFFIIPKDTKHEYWADDNSPWSIYWMHFDGTAAQSIYERYSNGTNKNGTTAFDSTRIHLFDQIFKLFKSDYVAPKMEYATILAQGLLGSFVYADIDDDVSTNTTNDILNQIMEFLNDNLDKSFKSEDISKKFNYSVSYLYTIFKKRTGYSLVHFINLKKIQRACEYLKYTDLSIKEIGYSLGFQDPLYFSRLFKKYMDHSPRAYRKKQRN